MQIGPTQEEIEDQQDLEDGDFDLFDMPKDIDPWTSSYIADLPCTALQDF